MLSKAVYSLPSTQAILTYLIVTGIVTTLALSVALLLFLAYLLQILVLSLAEIVHSFNSLDPLARVLIIALVTVCALYAWKVRKYGH